MSGASRLFYADSRMRNFLLILLQLAVMAATLCGPDSWHPDEHRHVATLVPIARESRAAGRTGVLHMPPIVAVTGLLASMLAVRMGTACAS